MFVASGPTLARIGPKSTDTAQNPGQSCPTTGQVWPNSQAKFGRHRADLAAPGPNLVSKSPQSGNIRPKCHQHRPPWHFPSQTRRASGHTEPKSPRNRSKLLPNGSKSIENCSMPSNLDGSWRRFPPTPRRTGAKSSRHRPKLIRSRPHLVEFPRKYAKRGPRRSKIGQHQADFGRNRHASAESKPHLTNIGPTSSQLCPNRAATTRAGHTWSARPRSRRVRPRYFVFSVCSFTS